VGRERERRRKRLKVREGRGKQVGEGKGNGEELALFSWHFWLRYYFRSEIFFS